MKNLPTGYTCTDCGATHDFPENIALQWNQPVAHTCTCGTARKILKGAVYVLPASMPWRTTNHTPIRHSVNFCC
jgi:hypothetical protein